MLKKKKCIKFLKIKYFFFAKAKKKKKLKFKIKNNQIMQLFPL